MSRWDKVVAATAVFFGLCCLLTAATGLSAVSWLPSVWRGQFLAWAPLMCLVILTVLVATLVLPSVRSLKPRAMQQWVLLLMIAAVSSMVIYYMYRH